mgnify:CR=1 FL=1
MFGFLKKKDSAAKDVAADAPGPESGSWFTRLKAGLSKTREKLASQGTEPLIMTPQETGKWLANEKDRWAKVVKDSGLKVE